MPRPNPWTKLFLGLVVFSILGTLLTTLTRLDPGPIRPAASVLTIVAGVLALARSWRFLGVVGLGAAAEIVGLYTGFPFGKYEYTAAWWPTIPIPGDHRFPLLLPFAWFLVAGGSALALRPLGKSSLVYAPLLATLIDLFMEPVFTEKLGYWRWLEPGPLFGGAPWLNPVGWGLTSFFAVLILWKEDQNVLDATGVLGGYLALMLGLLVCS